MEHNPSPPDPQQTPEPIDAPLASDLGPNDGEEHVVDDEEEYVIDDMEGFDFED